MKIESWDDYWRLFDELCDSLAGGGQDAVARDLRDAKGWVNGLTDGWHEFHVRLKAVAKRHRLSPEHVLRLRRLTKEVARALRRRG